ncbi:adenosine kinase [Kitasatospora gansuensis]|uniref:Adenosine kinase n=1 Tax=Kitasatospora gansuensis TaxID=258050 RepID=A0A7W7WJ13_9ACTN|nr:PfkB family carbohydrate kinase [Kitasatospora gansuensis]MBB4949392.1 adenosine kinase [Kitasatospora gansuensis]
MTEPATPGQIVISGSIATDHLMTFPGLISDQLLPDQLTKVSLSFLVDGLKIRRGGVGANIALGLGRLGLRPLLVGAAGADHGEYDDWLRANGVDTRGVLTVPGQYTARFLCTTDRAQNQIASFHPGAMSRAADISLPEVLGRTGPARLVLIGADDPAAMLRRTAECRVAGLPFAADPSQQLARLTGDQVRTLVDGARWLFSNAYERSLLLERTGLTGAELLARVGTWFTTLGADGVLIERQGEPPIEVRPPRELRRADPTGVGDAFRAGVLAGEVWGLPLPVAARVGCLLATLALESVGTQEYVYRPEDFLRRLAEAYGGETAELVRPHVAAKTGGRSSVVGDSMAG